MDFHDHYGGHSHHLPSAGRGCVCQIGIESKAVGLLQALQNKRHGTPKRVPGHITIFSNFIRHWGWSNPCRARGNLRSNPLVVKFRALHLWCWLRHSTRDLLHATSHQDYFASARPSDVAMDTGRPQARKPRPAPCSSPKRREVRAPLARTGLTHGCVCASMASETTCRSSCGPPPSPLHMQDQSSRGLLCPPLQRSSCDNYRTSVCL